VSVAHCDDAHMPGWFGRQLIAAHFIVFGHWWGCTLVVGPSPPPTLSTPFAAFAVATMALEPSEGTGDAAEAAFFALMSTFLVWAEVDAACSHPLGGFGVEL
jgi:hypothetical protein